MNRQEHLENFDSLKSEYGLKEFIFMTASGYRHFFVLGSNLKEAEDNFMRIEEIKRNGFTLNDLPIRLEYNKEACKNWSMDDFSEHNENKEPNEIIAH